MDKSCIQNFCDDASHQISFERDCIFADGDDVLIVMPILRKCCNLRVLHLKCYEEESLFMDGLEQLSLLCPKIEHLSISDDTRGCYIYKDGLTLIQNCHQLKHLQLRFPAESTLDFFIENVILIKSLMMHSDSLSNLSTNLPLNNENCSLIANGCNLQQLFIQGTSTTLEGLTMICTSPTQFLQELCIVIDWGSSAEPDQRVPDPPLVSEMHDRQLGHHQHQVPVLPEKVAQVVPLRLVHEQSGRGHDRHHERLPEAGISDRER